MITLASTPLHFIPTVHTHTGPRVPFAISRSSPHGRNPYYPKLRYTSPSESNCTQHPAGLLVRQLPDNSPCFAQSAG